MNADEFYEAFKDALAYLGLQWGHKELATVRVDGNEVRVSYNGKTAVFTVAME